MSQIRDDATTSLAGHASVEEAHAALPVLLAVATRMHGLPALGRYAGELMNRHGGVGVMLQLLDSDDRRTRRWAFTSCLDGGLFAVARPARRRRTGTIRSCVGPPPTRSSTGTPLTRRRCGRC